MNNRSETFFKLRGEILESDSFEEIKSIVQGLTAGVELSQEEEIVLTHVGYSQLIQSTDDIELQNSLLLENLLPYCLDNRRKSGSDEKYALAKLREFVRDFIESLSEERQNFLRERINEECLQSLQDPEKYESSCDLIRSIGFKTEEVCQELVRLLKNARAKEFAADTLASLGVEGQTRAALTTAAKELAQSDSPRDSVFPLQELRNQEALEFILSLFDNEQYTDELFLYYCLIAAVKIGREFADDEKLQDRIWKCVSSNVDVDKHSIPLVGCNSCNVAKDLARWATKDGAPNSKRKTFYSHSNRLADVYYPKQIEGFEQVLSDPSTLQTLVSFATQDSRINGRSRTIEASEKKFAWKWLMNSGFDSAVETALEAVRNEANDYVKAEILELLAMYRIDDLPVVVKQLVEEVHDCGNGDGTLFSRVAATKVATSCCSRAAWKSLLNFGFTVDNNVLRSTVDAVWNVASHLLSRGDLQVTSDLFDATHSNAHSRTRETAASVLARLVWTQKFDSDHVEEYLELVKDPSFNTYLTERLLEGVKNFSLKERTALLPWAIEQLGSDEPSVVVADFLAETSQEEADTFIFKYLKLPDESDIGNIGPKQWQDGWLLARLYQREASRFEGAVCEALRGGGSDLCFELCHSLWRFGLQSEALGAAIAERITERPEWIEYERFLFSAFSAIAPQTFLLDWWKPLYDLWKKETKVAFLLSHSELSSDDKTKQAVISRFIHCTGDSNQVVRGAAFRQLALADSSVLFGLVHAWANSSSGLIRTLAAEALEFLPLSEFSGLVEAAESLRLDSIRLVREKAKRSIEEGEMRGLSRSYISQIFTLIKEELDPVVKGFRYGDAVCNIGNEDDLNRLQEFVDAYDGKLMPNVSQWLASIRKALKSKLEKHSKDGGHNWVDTQLIGG